MNIVPTVASLALLTLVIILLGVFWLRVPVAARIFLFRGAIVMITAHVLFTFTKWGTTSDRVNVIITWLGVAGYELLLVLFARLSPRWLTSISAFILLMPVFASSVLLPLVSIFDSNIYEFHPISTNLAYQKIPWGEGGNTTVTTGIQILLVYRPHLLPFFRREIQPIFFSNDQCNANAAFVVPGSGPKDVLARCPHWPSQRPGTEDQLIAMP